MLIVLTAHLPTPTKGPVAGSLVSANRWLRDTKTFSFPWYLTPVSANHASSNPVQVCCCNTPAEGITAMKCYIRVCFKHTIMKAQIKKSGFRLWFTSKSN